MEKKGVPEHPIKGKGGDLNRISGVRKEIDRGKGGKGSSVKDSFRNVVEERGSQEGEERRLRYDRGDRGGVKRYGDLTWKGHFGGFEKSARRYEGKNKGAHTNRVEGGTGAKSTPIAME